jgi:NAD+ synthase (glutamine-hydrolysing)
VPKTLNQLPRRVDDRRRWGRGGANEAPGSVLATEISLQLVPCGPGRPQSPPSAQRHSSGHYELQDFRLYYLVRFGYRPSPTSPTGRRAT